MDREAHKRRAAEAAMRHVQPGSIIGVGTGSTVRYFIDALARMRDPIAGAVASSEATATLLRARGIEVVDLNGQAELPLYVDGADEATRHLALIKGGGGAHTREKICAATSRRFICIVDESKLVDVLGAFPVAVEVLPMARSHVARALARLGGEPELRLGFRTDEGNVILDTRFPAILDPPAMERAIDAITGVVENGLFALRGADLLIVGGAQGVEELGRG